MKSYKQTGQVLYFGSLIFIFRVNIDVRYEFFFKKLMIEIRRIKI